MQMFLYLNTNIQGLLVVLPQLSRDLNTTAFCFWHFHISERSQFSFVTPQHRQLSCLINSASVLQKRGVNNWIWCKLVGAKKEKKTYARLCNKPSLSNVVGLALVDYAGAVGVIVNARLLNLSWHACVYPSRADLSPGNRWSPRDFRTHLAPGKQHPRDTSGGWQPSSLPIRLSVF